MRFKSVGNKADLACVVIRNNESTLAIKVGAPVALDPTGSNLGVDVKSVVSLAAASQGNFFGIALAALNPGDFGEAQVFGYNGIARTVLTTRSATTATWASVAAGSYGEYLTIGTGTGNTASNGDQALVRVDTAPQTAAQFARLMETFASIDTLASSLGPQSMSVWTTTRKVFLRAM